MDWERHMPLLICLGIDNYVHVQTVDTRPFFLGRVGPGKGYLVLHLLISFSVLVLKRLCSVQALLSPDEDQNTVHRQI